MRPLDFMINCMIPERTNMRKILIVAFIVTNLSANTEEKPATISEVRSKICALTKSVEFLESLRDKVSDYRLKSNIHTLMVKRLDSLIALREEETRLTTVKPKPTPAAVIPAVEAVVEVKAHAPRSRVCSMWKRFLKLVGKS